VLGRLGCCIRCDAEPGDRDERGRQEPDEEPVGKRAGDDAAADLDVSIDHLEDGVDGRMPPSLGLSSRCEMLTARPQSASPDPRSADRRMRDLGLG